MRSRLPKRGWWLHQNGGRRDERWSEMGYILKVDPAGFHGDLDIGVRGREESGLMLGFLARVTASKEFPPT